jgi:hypothetical protein
VAPAVGGLAADQDVADACGQRPINLKVRSDVPHHGGPLAACPRRRGLREAPAFGQGALQPGAQLRRRPIAHGLFEGDGIGQQRRYRRLGVEFGIGCRARRRRLAAQLRQLAGELGHGDGPRMPDIDAPPAVGRLRAQAEGQARQGLGGIVLRAEAAHRSTAIGQHQGLAGEQVPEQAPGQAGQPPAMTIGAVNTEQPGLSEDPVGGGAGARQQRRLGAHQAPGLAMQRSIGHAVGVLDRVHEQQRATSAHGALDQAPHQLGLPGEQGAGVGAVRRASAQPRQQDQACAPG